MENQIHKLDQFMDKKKKRKNKNNNDHQKDKDSMEMESTTPLGNLSSNGNDDEKSVTKLYEDKNKDLMGNVQEPTTANVTPNINNR